MTGPFGVILCDPPWRYSNDGVQGAAELAYPTMTMAELRALPVADLAAPDAVLLLWATWPLLDEAIGLLAAWDFEYKTGFPWVKLDEEPRRTLWGDTQFKPQYGTGFWGRGCSEPILIGVRGRVAVPARARNSVFLLSENYQHSRKPENLYAYAEAFPGPYCELFGRRARPGWTTLGNGLDGRDIREALAETIGIIPGNGTWGQR